MDAAFDSGLAMLERAYIAQGWRIVRRDFMKVGDREFVKYRILDPERNLEAEMVTALWIIEYANEEAARHSVEQVAHGFANPPQPEPYRLHAARN